MLVPPSYNEMIFLRGGGIITIKICKEIGENLQIFEVDFVKVEGLYSKGGI